MVDRWEGEYGTKRIKGMERKEKKRANPIATPFNTPTSSMHTHAPTHTYPRPPKLRKSPTSTAHALRPDKTEGNAHDAGRRWIDLSGRARGGGGTHDNGEEPSIARGGR